MTQNVREIFEATLRDEPPPVDMVAGAVEGARLKRRRQRRTRIAVAASPVALVLVAAGVYAVRPGSSTATVGDRPTPAATPHTRPSFPPVAESKPVNPTPEVHKAALQMCSRDWSAVLAPAGSNMVPATQQQAVDMCTMTGETLMTLMPGATVTLPDALDLSMPTGPGEQWVVKTPAGRTQIGVHYLWPDSSYEKTHYGPLDECRPNPVHNPPATTVTGPDGKPFPIKDQSAGHDQFCFQTRPAQQFYGALTLDQTDQTVAYGIVDHDYGRYLIGTAAVSIPVATKPTEGQYSEVNGKYIVTDKNESPAMTPAQFGNVLLDPRFNDYLVRYESYVLTHATADSFVVSGSRPVR